MHKLLPAKTGPCLSIKQAHADDDICPSPSDAPMRLNMSAPAIHASSRPIPFSIIGTPRTNPIACTHLSPSQPSPFASIPVHVPHQTEYPSSAVITPTTSAELVRHKSLLRRINKTQADLTRSAASIINHVEVVSWLYTARRCFLSMHKYATPSVLPSIIVEGALSQVRSSCFGYLVRA